MYNPGDGKQAARRRASKTEPVEDNITPVSSTHEDKEDLPTANWFSRAMRRSAWGGCGKPLLSLTPIISTQRSNVKMENRFNDSTKRARLARRLPALALSLGLGLFAPAFGQQARQIRTSEATDPPQIASAWELSRAFVEAAKRIKPAVAHIKLGNGATGSGVVVSPGGYILTNNHVASAGNQITVKLSDRREFTARRIGTDPKTD